MNDTMMTLVGNVVDEPRLRRTGNGNDVANFRLASTSRRYDREAGTFVDNATLFVSVTCWRQFGKNIHQSLHKGQPVVVTGRFTMREFKVDEQLRTAYELEAIAVGHDLSRGTTRFVRVHPNTSPVTPVVDENGIPLDESDHWVGVADGSYEVEDDGSAVEADTAAAARELVAAG